MVLLPVSGDGIWIVTSIGAYLHLNGKNLNFRAIFSFFVEIAKMKELFLFGLLPIICNLYIDFFISA